jgi:hypothetical protein
LTSNLALSQIRRRAMHDIGKTLLAKLVELLAEQEGLKITYKMEEIHNA